jgi:predicted dinucleotide-binding enzyme
MVFRFTDQIMLTVPDFSKVKVDATVHVTVRNKAMIDSTVHMSHQDFAKVQYQMNLY